MGIGNEIIKEEKKTVHTRNMRLKKILFLLGEDRKFIFMPGKFIICHMIELLVPGVGNRYWNTGISMDVCKMKFMVVSREDPSLLMIN